jgi:aminopeptidase N
MKQFFFFFFTIISLVIEAQQPIDVQHYKFEIELTDASDAINGKATVTVQFLNDASLLQLDLVSLTDEKGMIAFQVLENGQNLQKAHRDDKLDIYLANPAKKDEIRSFEINYMGTPKDGLVISKNKYGDRTFFGDNWPDRAHNWLPTNDVPADKASVQFIVTAPSQYKIISNGILVEEKELGNNKKRTHWKEDGVIPTKVMVIGAAKFSVARVDSSYRIPVTAWVYPQDSANGFFDYALADDILKFFENYIGAYPYKKLANVQSTTIFGGMENASAIFYGEKTVKGDRSSEALLAHEIAHQWFGNTATEKSFAHVWLSEGFATYLTNIYIEQKYGRDSLYKRLEDDKAKIVKFVRRSNNAVVDSTSDLMDLLNANSYQKGGWVLHMLRNQVGDSVFKKILQTYYQQYKWSNADTRDFQLVAEKVSGEDLAQFFNQWLYQQGIPELKIKTKMEADEITIEIEQEKKLFNVVLEVVVIAADDETTTHRIPVKEKKTIFKFKTKGPVRLSIDPEMKLLFSK